MNTPCTLSTIDFQSFGKRQVSARFNGGALRLREVNQALILFSRLTKCFTDYRDPEKIEHLVEQLVSQRIYGISLGYEGVNDYDTLRYGSQLAFFGNSYLHLPLYIFCGEYLLCARLRRSNIYTCVGAEEVSERVIGQIRER